MNITVAQLNPVIGDINGNLKKIVDTLLVCNSTDLVVFSELFLTGYPPRDLLKRSWFIERTQKAIDKLVELSAKYNTGILFGAPTKNNTGGVYNSAILIYQGEVLAIQHKSLLPTYDVFDEARYFDKAPEIHIVPFRGEILGISICEDAWSNNYTFDPIQVLAEKGATIFINISASPFHIGKEEIRYRIVKNHAIKHNKPFVMVNQVGGNDELIFDGRSMCVNASGELIEILPSFKEHIETIDTNASKIKRYVPQERIESVYHALVLGTKDYMRKCGFSKAVLGLSGGIDSAVTCCIAKEAIGSQNVIAVSMPGPYSSKGSIEDAKKIAHNLGIKLKIIPISKIYSSYLDSLKEHFEDSRVDTTEENIQARIRGNILMALSNKFGYLVLSTGNKSELAVGYCTLYGDMSGGLGVISDVPKTMVYELADYINRHSEIIPKEVIEKPPSAELKPDQKDQDTLPPYDILDQILHYYLDEGYSLKHIVKLGFDSEIVEWVIHMVNKNEYKRRQAAPGLKVTTKAFGMGWRMPIAAMY